MPSFADLAERVMPAVVSIQVEQGTRMSERRGRRRGPPGGMPMDPFDFFHFFGEPPPQQRRGTGLGSGVVIQDDGLILTNYHVVEGADLIEVSFATPDGVDRTVPAKLLGQAPEYDVALIKTEGESKVPVAPLGDSDSVRIGDWVMAVGSPFGLSHSVSVGIISAKERRDVEPSGRRGLYNFLQTDASINPGNSGGPLINLSGEVIGINSAINAQGQGIGFAIPINMVKGMLPQLTKEGRFTRSWIGVGIQPLTDDLARSLGLDTPLGALVSSVQPDSPGDEAGIKEGDVILEFDGKKVRASSELPLFTSMAGVGTEVTLKVWRDKREKSIKVKLGEFPGAPQEEADGEIEGGGELGLTVSDLTDRLRQEFQLEASQGVLVTDVEPMGLAARAGLRPGDLIISVNGAPLKAARDFASLVRDAKGGEVLRILVNRRGDRFFTAIRKP